MILKILFWVPFILILHTYVIYPVLLVLFDKIAGKTLIKDENGIQPSVSVLMAVHNEELVIVQKIRALYESDYPLSKLEVIVGSDSSDDNTDSFLNELKLEYPSLKVIFFSTRLGKPAVINKLSMEATGEILIITDANVMPSESAISQLVKHFRDETTGLADSRLINSGVKNNGIPVPEVAYKSFEWKLKNIEGRLWGKMMGPFGGFYALRKDSYQPNPGNILADDFRICMNVLKKGLKAVSSHEAVVYEDIPDNLREEFKRKVRISAGNFQNLMHSAGLFLKPFSTLSFCFISHKALRWLTPFFWISVLITNVLLVNHSFFFSLLLLLQVIFILLPPLDIFLRRIKIDLLPLRFFTHFCFMNIALLAGFVRYLQGIKSGVWTPTKRYQ